MWIKLSHQVLFSDLPCPSNMTIFRRINAAWIHVTNLFWIQKYTVEFANAFTALGNCRDSTSYRWSRDPLSYASFLKCTSFNRNTLEKGLIKKNHHQEREQKQQNIKGKKETVSRRVKCTKHDLHVLLNNMWRL